MTRCYFIQKTKDLWFGCAVDYCLTIEAETLAEADGRLMEQVRVYKKDMQPHEGYRPAPLRFRFGYWWVCMKEKFVRQFNIQNGHWIICQYDI